MKILKHTNSGTRAALPSYIWDGLNAGGFDPRLGKGYYGVGAYFAEKASYSLAYEYRGKPGVKQMFWHPYCADTREFTEPPL